MQLAFLGGASGIGASCLLLRLGDRRVLIDAGVRVDRKADPLPDLAALDGEALSAIFVTHAHADHIGAIPLVHASFPGVPIYASAATVRLMEVMLADAVRVMGRRAADELEIPLYDERLVASTLRRLRPLPYAGELSVSELPGVTVHISRAGHVAGAVMLGFDSPDGRLLVSGDVSMTPQRTVGPAALPGPRFPDLLVLESTYGARLHPNRQAEEARLAQAVAEGVGSGHVLIPAFALGRAQEVIMILRAAQRDRVIPEFPIWVDGLVRTVCATYAAIPEALSRGLAKHILGGGQPFFGKTVRSVESPTHRTAILEGEPACIISSSGMLTGGPSAYYAERLAGDPKASIMITGYQDEESPGRKLLELERQGGGTLEIGGRSIPVGCRVGKYALSAHADGGELAGLVAALKPRAVALVHGDPESRAALAARLAGQTEVLLPRDGEEVAVRAAHRSGKRAAVALPEALPVGLGEDAEPDAAGLERLWRELDDGTGVRSLGVRELARAWWGGAAGEVEETRIQEALEGQMQYFAPLPDVPGVYRVRTVEEVRRYAETGGRARPDQTGILAVVDRYLGDAPGLYRRGVDPDTGTVTLYFHFPDAARRLYSEAMDVIAEEAGVEVRVHPSPHQGMLAEAALAALPPGLTPTRAPSLLLNEKVARVRCEGEVTEAELRAATARFEEETAWKLELAREGQPAAAAMPDVIEPPPGVAPIHMQAALSAAAAAFRPEPGYLKAGADQGTHTLLLRFSFPEVARERYSGWLHALAEQTGWRVAIHPGAHHGALEAEARRVLPPGLRSLGPVSIRPVERQVVMRYTGEAAPEALEAARAEFEERTGWELVPT